jgi:hypothetical protein
MYMLFMKVCHFKRSYFLTCMGSGALDDILFLVEIEKSGSPVA